MPILKARKDEFRAIAELTAPHVPHLLPVLEVVPTADGPGKDLWKFTMRAADSIPAGLLIAVDVHRLAAPLSGLNSPLEYLARDLAALGMPMLPVVRPADPDAQFTVAGRHSDRAVVRVPITAAVGDLPRRLKEHADLLPEQCDLLLDAAAVRSQPALARTEPTVRSLLARAGGLPWRSITLAAGAMPRNLPAQPLTVVPRWDLALWQRLRDTGIQYGDYGITHPQISGPGWRPSPTLRYTHDDAWHIHHRPDSHPIAVADPAFSWGDAELARHAESPEGHRPNWRAWGTSHHLAHVVHHLIGDHGPHAGRR